MLDQVSSWLRHRLTIISLVGFGFLGGLALVLLNGNAVSALDSSNCLSCHAALDLGKTNKDGRNISLKISADDLANSAHKYIDCVTCHGDKPHESPTDLTKLSSAQKCGSCHQDEYKQHLNSIHGQELAKGNSDVATCVDCHSLKQDAHSIIKVTDFNSPTFKKNIADTCGRCHNDQVLMDNYGIVDKVYESYMRSFHGKVMDLSSNDLTQLNVATCTNCHGVHNILAVNDKSSPVAGMANLVQTCDKCHPGAGVEFAKGFLGHKEASPSFIPVAHYAEKGFVILLYSVIGVGAIIVILAIFGYSRRRWRK